jgi:hypothetical protein
MTKPLRIPLGPQIYSQFLSCMTDFFLSEARRWAGRVVDLKLSIRYMKPDQTIKLHCVDESGWELAVTRPWLAVLNAFQNYHVFYLS